ncbi:esterase [Pseudomonas sp. HMWF010]|nr:esterase [Pseudomonas sp. HMWF010]
MKLGRLSIGALLMLLCLVDVQAQGLRDALSDRRSAKSAAQLGAELLADLPYGTHARQRLDVYRPLKAKSAPILLMMHGGAWDKGDKRMDRVVENKLARWLPQGYLFVSVNYRLIPDAMPVQQAEDIAQALSYVQQHATGWGGDPQRVVLLGHSAGAHLVSLLSAAPEIGQAYAVQPWLGTVALDSAAFDVERIMRDRHYRLYDKAFGQDLAYWRAASPLWRLQQAGAPMLAVCSSKREEACRQAQGFAKRGSELGMQVTVLPLALSHGEINAQLGVPGAYTDAVETFLQRIGAGPTP